MRIITIPNGQFAENCYLVAAPGASDAIIIDPGEEPAVFLGRARAEGLTIREIWLTHGHLDHVSGVGAIREATGAPISLHAADQDLYQNLPQQARWFGLDLDEPPPVDRWIEHATELAFGALRFDVRHAPGHSPGSVLFVQPGVVIGGDVLFQGSIGRTDLPGGDYETLIRSIQTELLTLPDHTVVYPGHGPPTTIGAERRSNPFLR